MADDPKKAPAVKESEVPTATYEVWHSLSHDKITYKRGDKIAMPVDQAALLVASRVLVAPGTTASLALLQAAPIAPETAIVPVTI